MAAESCGARAIADGLDCGSAIWNSEGIQGDAEVWEMTGPNVYLGRSFVQNHHALGRYRGGVALGIVVGGARFASRQLHPLCLGRA